MNKLKAHAFGKINLCLEVLAKRDDGYHEVRSVIRSVDIKDEIEVSRSNDLRLSCDSPNIQGEANRIGEFLGILKFSAEGAKIFVSKYDELMRKNVGEFHEASTILKAYITDMLQELIDQGVKIEPVFISGKWSEIDTMQDLKKAEKIFPS